MTLEITAFEIARQLKGDGLHCEAAELLSRFISENPTAATPRIAALLGELTYCSHLWQEASEILQAFLDRSTEDPVPLLQLAHSAIELGAPHLLARTKPLLARALEANSAAATHDEVLQPIYFRIGEHVGANSFSTALELLRLAALPGTYVAQAAGHGTIRRKLADDEIEQKLASAQRDWEERGEPPPRNLPHCWSCCPKDAPLPAKVLLVMRSRFFDSPDSREHELTYFFRQSARLLGIPTVFAPADAYLGSSRFTKEQQYHELERLLQLITAERPELVIFDEFCNQDQTALLGKSLYADVFLKLKAELGLKLVAYYPDAWTAGSRRTIEFVGSVADVIWHHDADISDDHRFAARMFLSPPPYPIEIFESVRQPKDLGVVFSGTVSGYNYPRAVWIALLKEHQVPCDIMLSDHSLNNSPGGAMPESYAKFLSRTKCGLNFSARTPAQKIMTGRAWETIISNSLLFEEDNEAIKRFFVPFVHYIPFSNIHELKAYISFFQRHDHHRAQIADRAYSWYRQTFSHQKVWRALSALLQRH